MISTNFLFRQFYDDAESILFMDSLKKFVNLFNKILERDKNETHKEIKITQKKNLGALKEVIQQIEAELKRRQNLFNEAREKLHESSINIYKYQQY